jgi:PAS domain S-box-containing protein
MQLDGVHHAGQAASGEVTEALARASSRFEALIKNLHAAVLVEDQDRRVVLANATLCEMFGIETHPEQLVGVDCSAMLEQAKSLFMDPDGFTARISELIQSGEPAERDELLTVDGRVLVRDFVPVEVNGQRHGQLWQYRDITHRRAEQALQRAITETAMDAIVTIDHEGKILEFNPAAEAIFGHERKSVLGRSMAEVIIPPNLREAHAAGLARYAASEQGRILGQRVALSAMRADGSEFPVELTVNRIPGSNPPVFTGFIRDITEDQEQKEELRRAKEAAEEASRAKSEFLAVMSHEIRTPMNAILGMTELSMDLAVQAEQKGLLRSVHSNAESLLNVINDVLDFSTMEAGHLRLRQEAFAIADVVESVAEVLAPRAFEKGVELSCTVDPRIPRAVEGDPNRLRQVLVNLVGNAVKFTQTGEISLETAPHAGDGGEGSIRFTVRDTGIGVSPESLERIFDPFFQADTSMSRKFGGTGLGLGISRSLIEMMGGRIRAHSVQGQGSEFTFEIPLKRAQHAFARRRASDASYERWHAWAVTQSPTVARGVARALESLGIPCESVPAEDLAERLRPNGLSQVRHVVIAEHRLGLTKLGKVAAVARAAAESVEVRLCVLIPPGPVDPWRVDGPPSTRYLTKPATRRKLCAMIAENGEATRDALPRLPVDSARRTGGRILLVEDNEANRDFATRVLAGGGYTVDVANDGSQGLRLALERDYDLILTDLEMPVMDGFEMTREILERRTDRSVPIVALSAHVVEGFSERCRAAGMVDYVSKPVRPADLLKAVEESIRPSSVVLVVDDNEDNLELTQRYLEGERLTVETVDNGRDAVGRIRQGDVSLVLLDMNMPDLDGYETARRIRSLPGLGDLPIIAMTSWAGAEEERRCLEAGCTAYLQKPLRRSALLDTVAGSLQPRPATSPDAEAASVPVAVDPAIADLVPEYLEGRRRDVVSLHEHLKEGDLDAIRTLAHNLAGSGEPYGFPKITELGRTLESVATEGSREEVAFWVDELAAYLDSVEWQVDDEAL